MKMEELTRDTVSTASWDDLFAFMEDKTAGEITAFKNASIKTIKDGDKVVPAMKGEGKPVYDLVKARAFIKKTYFAITKPEDWFSRH